jgi:hypothetical protein
MLKNTEFRAHWPTTKEILSKISENSKVHIQEKWKMKHSWNNVNNSTLLENISQNHDRAETKNEQHLKFAQDVQVGFIFIKMPQG